MRLESVEISGYRSVKGPLTLYVDGRTTVILGANDHGKTNILNALIHLNADHPFDSDDINWDMPEKLEDYPLVVGTFSFSESEREELLTNAFEGIEVEEQKGEEETEEESEEGTEEDESEEETKSNPSQIDEIEPDLDQTTDEPSELVEPDTEEVPKKVTLIRKGMASVLTVSGGGTKFPIDLLSTFIRQSLPRIELIQSFDSLNDSVSATEISEEANEFMQGIFHTAGIDPMDSAPLFSQDDRTSRQLSDASLTLSEALRSSWLQGREGDLQFKLEHRKQSNIDLLIQDPSVGSRSGSISSI